MSSDWFGDLYSMASSWYESGLLLKAVIGVGLGAVIFTIYKAGFVAGLAVFLGVVILAGIGFLALDD